MTQIKGYNFAENFSDASPFKTVEWEVLRNEALDVWQDQDKIRDFPQVIGTDASAEMIKISKNNASMALPEKIAESIIWEVSDFCDVNTALVQDLSPGILVTNPPFGTRINFIESSKIKFIEEKYLS